MIFASLNSMGRKPVVSISIDISTNHLPTRGSIFMRNSLWIPLKPGALLVVKFFSACPVPSKSKGLERADPLGLLFFRLYSRYLIFLV